MNEIIQLISSVGFPIFACIALWWQMYQEQKYRNEEFNNLRTAVDNNTEVINKLLERWDEYVDGN